MTKLIDAVPVFLRYKVAKVLLLKAEFSIFIASFPTCGVTIRAPSNPVDQA